MATYYKRKGARGIRWTVRVRLEGREVTKTFATKGHAETWARSQETAIESGEFKAVDPSAGVIFADLVDAFLRHRKAIKRAPGKTFGNALVRLKDEHGLEPASTLGSAFWRRHALGRIAGGVTSQTAVAELAYAGSVLAHARRQKLIADARGPAEARAEIADEGLRINSRQRTRRISDAELKALLAACDRITSSVPLGTVVRFALATAMRRGEILRVRFDDVDEVARIVIIRNRKDPKDAERVDKAPLMSLHAKWPRWDALALIQAQPRAGPLVFPYQGDTVGERFELACKDAGLKGIVFHLLRHEALSRYAERGFDVMRLQLIGGHRDIRHLQRYVKLDAARLANE
ncbi:MAG: site-specific integrase [Betaproteobacteria bacterium]